MKKFVLLFAIALAAITGPSSPALATTKCHEAIEVVCDLLPGHCDPEDCLICVDQLPTKPVCPIN